MVRFIRKDDLLLLSYTPEYAAEIINAKLGIDFSDDGKIVEYTDKTMPKEMKQLRGALQQGFSIIVNRVFHFNRANLSHENTEEEVYVFVLGVLRHGYYAIEGRIFNVAQTVLVHESMKIDRKLFCAGYEKRTSVIEKLGKLVSEDETEIVIGGENENAIPAEEYYSLLSNFPTTYELQRLAEARITGFIQNYLETKRDYSEIYQNYSKRKHAKSIVNMSLTSNLLDSKRLETYQLAHKNLLTMLEESESMSEEAWQQGILQLLPILFPQYILVIPKVKIRDKINTETHYREIDFLLVDASGNVDIIEIKRAFEKNSLLRGSVYRGNHIPAKELAGGIMQIEKYIYYLQNWGQNGEKELTERYKERLPEGLSMRFLSPKGLLIMGNCEFSDREQRDFDLIRRKYSKIADIITYNDFVNRLERLIASLEMPRHS